MKTRYPAFVLLNPTAAGGRAAEWWIPTHLIIDGEVEAKPLVRLHPWSSSGTEARELQSAAREAFDRGRRLFVAAGGDGTVNLLVNVLVRSLSGEELRAIRLGAIGLGSSNDFHRPARPGQRAGDRPVRLDLNRLHPRDIGILEWEPTDGGMRQRRCFTVSASIGIVTLGNQLFNAAEGVLGRLKRRWTNGAIGLATLQACRAYTPFRARLVREDGPAADLELVHLGVMKSPYLAGGLSYDFDVRPDDEQLTIALAHRMGRIRTFLTMLTLIGGGFSASRHTEHFRTSRLSVDGPEPFRVELDGELVTGSNLLFTILPQALSVCGPGLPNP